MIGTQEIIILLTLGLPVIIIYFLVRFFKAQQKRINNTTGMNVTIEIEKLFALKEKGAITEQEFESRKLKLLNQS